jgi:hypothetical protein
VCETPASPGRHTVLLINLGGDRVAEYTLALALFGFNTDIVASGGSLTATVANDGIIVAPIASLESGSLVRTIAAQFPDAILIAALNRVTPRSEQAAKERGAWTVVDLLEPPIIVAEKIYRASLGAPFIHRPLGSTPRPAIPAEALVWLELLSQSDMTVSDVARMAGWSRAAFYRRLQVIYRELGAKTRREAVARARERGLLP